MRICSSGSWRARRALDARPAVITFDAHPDEVLVGTAPPLLLDPDERLERLASAGVEVTVVPAFRRRGPPDAVRRVRPRDRRADRPRRIPHDARRAFGHERRGTPEALAALGERGGLRGRRRAAVHRGRDARSAAPRSAGGSRRATWPVPRGCSGGRTRSSAIWTGTVGWRLRCRSPAASGRYRVDGCELVVEEGGCRLVGALGLGRRRITFE